MDYSRVANWLFGEFSGIYGPVKWSEKFKSQGAIDQWQKTWASSMSAHNLSRDEIATGVAACKDRIDWPPSFPEFKNACRPRIDFHSAFIEAARQLGRREFGEDAWSHPAIYWAAVSMSSEIKTSSWEKLEKRWTTVLQAQLAKGAWDPVPAAALPAPPPQRDPAASEHQRQLLRDTADRLRREFAVERKESGAECKPAPNADECRIRDAAHEKMCAEWDELARQEDLRYGLTPPRGRNA